MQSKESLACEAGEYLGRLRRAMPMQVYIYICWHLELSGNANLRLYQCWFAFTHRSPIKNFASCRLREKNFASLRLRKNLVELRARLSLLVDKTTFQYSVLTMHYTTIGGHAHFVLSTRSHGGRGRPGPSGSSPAPARRGGRDALDAPDHPPPAPAAMAEGDAPDVPDHHHQRPPWWNGRPGRQEEKNRWHMSTYFLPPYFRFNALLTTCALYLSCKSTSPHAFARTHTP